MAPVINHFSSSPAQGPVSGLQPYLLNLGSGFVAGATVTFGGVPATNVVWVSALRIECETPPHALGFVDITVTNPDTSSDTWVNGYRYIADKVVIQVTPSTVAATLARATIGSGVTLVGAPTLTGDADGIAAGTFSGLNAALLPSQQLVYFGLTAMDTGVVLTNGRASDVQHAMGTWRTQSGKDLTPTAPARDAAGAVGDDIILTYQIVPIGRLLVVPFMFGSNEYNEWDGDIFNDIATVKLDGVNISVIPVTSALIAVNTVYPGGHIDADGMNAGFWRAAGTASSGIAFDGLVGVNLVQIVVPGQTYTLEIRVKDIADGLVDSGILVGLISSFTPPLIPPPTPTPPPGFPPPVSPDYYLNILAALGLGVTEKNIRRVRITPHLSNGQLRMFYPAVHVEVRPGIGNRAEPGLTPQVMLSVSFDGGYTWAPDTWMNAGEIGNYTQRVVARQVGYGRSATFRVTVSDPNTWDLVAAYFDPPPVVGRH